MRTLVIFSAAALLLAGPAQEPRFDVIIRGGTVIDGTGAPARRADVAVRGGTIARVGNLAGDRARIEIDARGLVVTPGFINVHSHASPAALGTAVNMLTQGVTTELLNADGAGPIDLPQAWQPLEAAGLAVNVAASIGFNSIWEKVVGLSDRRPTDAEIEQMRSLLTTGLGSGAIGVSGGLDYKPAYFATTDEVVRVLEAARPWRTFFPNHDRTIPELGFSSYAGMDETRVIGQRAGLVPEFTHMKIQGHEHGTASRVLGLMDREAAAGRWITADVYPYLAGQTGLASLIIPGWAQAGGVDSMRARFRDPELRRRIIKEADEAMNARFTGPENILVAPNRRLSEIIAANGSATPGEAVVQVLEKEMPSAILGFGVESDLVEILRHPAVAVACDCGAATGSRGHPRYFGTFPRVLGRYVREQHALTWEAAVRKMTGLPAAMMGLPDRGLLAPGMAADVVVFDSATVIDHATFEAPALPSEGIRHVLVNGQVALRDGAATGTQGGRILRGARYLPSRPLDLGATRVEAKGTVSGGPLAGARLTVMLTQSARRPGALGAVVVTGDDQAARFEGGTFGVVQRVGRWATVTGRMLVRPDPTDRPFTLVLDGADPALPPNFHLFIEGLPPLEGSLGGDLVVR